MSSVLCLYGMIISIVMVSNLKRTEYTTQVMNDPLNWKYTYSKGYLTAFAGMANGLSQLAAGLCIGIIGDIGVRGNAQRDVLVAVILMMIFSEAIALYGFIISIVLVLNSG